MCLSLAVLTKPSWMTTPGGNVFLMNPIDPESLIYRLPSKLEFGSATMQWQAKPSGLYSG